MSEPKMVYVSPDGRDDWSGKLSKPNAAGTDGPLASLDGARQKVREFRKQGGAGIPVEVTIAGGRYPLRKPVQFGPEDSGPVVYRAAEGERPVFDAGVPITGWAETTVNGVAAWVADVSTILQRQGDFRSIYVNSEPRQQSRLPKQGYYEADFPNGAPENPHLFAGDYGFHAKPGDFKAWSNLENIEVVLLLYWAEQHLPVIAFDPATNRVTSSRKTVFAIRPKDSRYYIKNVFEALSEPGEWCLDRKTARLYYIPMPGESIKQTAIVAAVESQFLRLIGNPATGEWVEQIHFEGLTFRNAGGAFPRGWERRFDPYDPDGQGPLMDSSRHFGKTDGLSADVPYGNVPQGAHHVPGAIRMVGARRCRLEGCTIHNAGYYGIEIVEGCRDVHIVGNHLYDLGGGGVKIDGGSYPSPECTYTGQIVVTDNHIHAVGRVYHCACGILVCHAFQNRICHNHIHDLFYTGISVGWIWDRETHVTRENLIEKNHIYHVGQGVLSDMGGIYVLGTQPGTTLRGNLIHDIACHRYGAWGIYLDACTSYVIVQNNIVYNTMTECLHNNDGNAENLYRNNILAFGGKGGCAASQKNGVHPVGFEDRSMRFFGNIIIVNDKPLFGVQFQLQNGIPEKQEVLEADHNLYWDVTGAVPLAARENWTDDSQVGLDQWRAWGLDRHSVIADPRFADPANGDFTLPADSPAIGIGFVPIDMRDVGPRVRQIACPYGSTWWSICS